MPSLAGFNAEVVVRATVVEVALLAAPAPVAVAAAPLPITSDEAPVAVPVPAVVPWPVAPGTVLGDVVPEKLSRLSLLALDTPRNTAATRTATAVMITSSRQGHMVRLGGSPSALPFWLSSRS